MKTLKRSTTLKLTKDIVEENFLEMFGEILQQIWMQELCPHLSLKVFRQVDNIEKIYMKSIFRKFSKEENYEE